VKRFIFFGLIIVLILYLSFASNERTYINDRTGVVVLSEKIKEERPIRLGFVGDIMLDRHVLKSINENGGGDFDFIFEKIAPTVSAYDLAFANLEGPISLSGKNQGSKFSFRMRPDAATAIKEAGFDIVSVANNHIGDWGQRAMRDTYDYLTKSGIEYVGGDYEEEKAYQPRIFNIRGTNIAYLAFSQFGHGYTEARGENPGIAIIDFEKVKSAILVAKEYADIIIVSYHFGDEYLPEPNNYQKKVAEFTIDSGAHVVIGHHPHVIQPLRLYRGGYIFYSLGNFIFDQKFSEATMQGGLAEVEIENKKINKVELKKVRLNSFFQPELLEDSM